MPLSRPTFSRSTPVTNRFRRAQRVLRSVEFIHVMRGGKRYNHGSLTVHLCVSNTGHARLGIAVGRRVSLRANVRNAIKRTIREHFRHQALSLPPLDIVFNARPGAAKLSRIELAQLVASAFERVQQIKLPIEPPSATSTRSN